MSRSPNLTFHGHTAKEWGTVAQKMVKFTGKLRKQAIAVKEMLADSDPVILETVTKKAAKIVAETEVPVKRGPGRPKKVVEAAPEAPKKRGRPRKEVSIDDED